MPCFGEPKNTRPVFRSSTPPAVCVCVCVITPAFLPNLIDHISEHGSHPPVDMKYSSLMNRTENPKYYTIYATTIRVVGPKCCKRF